MVYPASVIFADTRNSANPRLLEISTEGKIVWEYVIPSSIVSGSQPRSGLDVEWLLNGNILFVMPFKGVYEVTPDKQIIWSYLDSKVSHDADRLPNGNTLIVWGWDENRADAQVKEVDKNGNVVWRWYAGDHFSDTDARIAQDGFSHTNGVVRLSSGNTLISLRTFDMLAEVDSSGEVVWSLRDVFRAPHDPEILPNGNILVADHSRAQQTMELTPSGELVWRFRASDIHTIRYNHQLPNGNIIFTDRTKIVEVTRSKEIVWQLELTDAKSDEKPMYKADKAGAQALP